MELYLLESFTTVARVGSLSKAATLRNISLPGISKHIKMLEEAFGFTLFYRRPRGMELTQKGSEALMYAEKILQHVESLRALSKQTTRIRIGVNISPDFLQLSRLASLVGKHFPGRMVVLTHDSSHLLLQRLETQDLDLCLAFGDIPGQFRKQPVCSVQLPLMIPLAHHGKNVAISSLHWIAGAKDCPFQKRLEEFWGVNGIKPHTRILAKDSSQKELVSQGLGTGFLEPQDALELFERGLAFYHDKYVLDIPLWVVYTASIFEPGARLLTEYVASVYECFERARKESRIDFSGCSVTQL